MKHKIHLRFNSKNPGNHKCRGDSEPNENTEKHGKIVNRSDWKKMLGENARNANDVKL